MQAKAKSNTTVIRRMLNAVGESTTIYEDAQALEWEVPGVGKLQLELSKIHDDVIYRAQIHGLSARIGDAAAVSADKSTGKTDPKAKFAAMKALVDHYASGSADWSPARATGGATGPRLDGLLISAVCEATGKSADEIRERIKVKCAADGREPSAYLAALAETPTVRPIVERMRAEQARGIDGEAELDGLMG